MVTHSNLTGDELHDSMLPLSLGARNETGVSIPEHTVVKTAGYSSANGKVIVEPLSAISDIPLGFVDVAIGNASNGYVIVQGVVDTSLDTTAAQINDNVYYDASGNLTLLSGGFSPIGKVVSISEHGKIYFEVNGLSNTSAAGGSVEITVGPFSFADFETSGTHDEITIQNAIDAVETAGGGTVKILPGTYNVDYQFSDTFDGVHTGYASMLVPSNVKIQGIGFPTLKIAYNNKNYQYIFVNKNYTQGTYSMQDAFVHYADLVLDGNAANYPAGVYESGVLLFFLNCHDCRADNIFVRKSIGDAIRIGDTGRGCNNITISNYYGEDIGLNSTNVGQCVFGVDSTNLVISGRSLRTYGASTRYQNCRGVYQEVESDTTYNVSGVGRDNFYISNSSDIQMICRGKDASRHGIFIQSTAGNTCDNIQIISSDINNTTSAGGSGILLTNSGTMSNIFITGSYKNAPSGSNPTLSISGSGTFTNVILGDSTFDGGNTATNIIAITNVSNGKITIGGTVIARNALTTSSSTLIDIKDSNVHITGSLLGYGGYTGAMRIRGADSSYKIKNCHMEPLGSAYGYQLEKDGGTYGFVDGYFKDNSFKGSGTALNLVSYSANNFYYTQPNYQPITGTGAVATYPNAKTHTVNNSYAMTGTDGSTLDFGTGGTIAYAPLYTFMSGPGSWSQWQLGSSGTPTITTGELGTSIDTGSNNNNYHNRYWRAEKNGTRLEFGTITTGHILVYEMDAQVMGNTATFDSNAQMQIGLLDGSPPAYDTQNSVRSILFRWTGSQLQTVTGDGTSVTTNNVSNNAYLNEVVRLKAVWTVGTNVVFSINGSTVATHTTNLPSGAFNMYIGFGIKTTTNAVKSMLVGRYINFYQLS